MRAPSASSASPRRWSLSALLPRLRRHAHSALRHGGRQSGQPGAQLRPDLRPLRPSRLGCRGLRRGDRRSPSGSTRRPLGRLPARAVACASTPRRWRPTRQRSAASCAPARRSAASGCSTCSPSPASRTLVARMGAAQMAASQSLLSLMHLSFMQVVGARSRCRRWSAAMSAPAISPPPAQPRHRACASAWPVHRRGAGLPVRAGALPAHLQRRPRRAFAWARRCSRSARRSRSPTRSACSPAAPCAAPATRAGRSSCRRGLAWGFFLPAAYVGGVALDGGLTGAWLGGVAYVAVLGLALRWRFSSGAWKRVRI